MSCTFAPVTSARYITYLLMFRDPRIFHLASLVAYRISRNWIIWNRTRPRLRRQRTESTETCRYDNHKRCRGSVDRGMRLREGEVVAERAGGGPASVRECAAGRVQTTRLCQVSGQITDQGSPGQGHSGHSGEIKQQSGQSGEGSKNDESRVNVQARTLRPATRRDRPPPPRNLRKPGTSEPGTR